MARYAYVNGRYVDHRDASVHIEDRGYQLADGVYEVVGVRDGRMIDETPHIDRLDRSLRELRIDWPGNIRQLRNVIERLLILAPAGGGPIRADVLPNDVSEDAPSVLRWEKGGEIMQLPLRDAREVFEREYLLAQVTRFGGNISRTATFVGMERSALHRKLKSLGLHGGSLDERIEPVAE